MLMRFVLALGLTALSSLANAAVHGSITAGLPSISPGLGWTGPIAQPADQSGWTTSQPETVMAQWDTLPTSAVLSSSTTPICVVAYAINVDHAHAAGLVSPAAFDPGVLSVTIAVDGGTFVAARHTKLGYTSLVDDWCVSVTPSSWPDGQHEFRAIVTPYGGHPRLLQSGGAVTLTANSPIFPAIGHGQKAAWVSASGALKQVNVTLANGSPDPDFPFVSLGYQIAGGGFDGDRFALADPTYVTKGNVPPFATAMAAATSSTAPLITQAQATPFVGGLPVTLAINTSVPWINTTPGYPVWATPQSYFYVCSLGLTSAHFYISDVLSDALDTTGTGCSHLWNAVGVVGGQMTAWPVKPATTTHSVIFSYGNAGGLERQLSLGESLFLTTNSHASMNFATRYIDPVAGVDPSPATAYNKQSCTSHASPCKTIHAGLTGAAAVGTDSNANNVGVAVTYGTDGGSPACTQMTYGQSDVNRRVAVGDSVVFNFYGTDPTSAGSSLTVANRLTVNAHYNTPTYFVTGTSNGGLSYIFSTVPGGSCVQYIAATLPTTKMFADIGGTTLVLMNATPGTPVMFNATGALEGGSEEYYSEQTYVTLTPDVGLSSHDVPIGMISNSQGFSTNKIHLQNVDVDPFSATASVTISSWTDGVGGTSTGAFSYSSASPQFSYGGTNPVTAPVGYQQWIPLRTLANEQDCYSAMSWILPHTYVLTPKVNQILTISGGAATQTFANSSSCPTPITISFYPQFSPNTGVLFWFDGGTSTAPGGLFSNPINNNSGGVFVDNATVQGSFLQSLSVRNPHIGGYNTYAVVGNVSQVFNFSYADTSPVVNMGLSANNPFTPYDNLADGTGDFIDFSVADWIAGNPSPGYALNNGSTQGGGAGTCNPGGYTNIKYWEPSNGSYIRAHFQSQTGTAILIPSTCKTTSTLQFFGDAGHTDFENTNADALVNYIAVNVSQPPSALGEGLWNQGNAGPSHGYAVINGYFSEGSAIGSNPLQAMGSAEEITDTFIANSTFIGKIGLTNSEYFYPRDVVFSHDSINMTNPTGFAWPTFGLDSTRNYGISLYVDSSACGGGVTFGNAATQTWTLSFANNTPTCGP